LTMIPPSSLRWLRASGLIVTAHLSLLCSPGFNCTDGVYNEIQAQGQGRAGVGYHQQ